MARLGLMVSQCPSPLSAHPVVTDITSHQKLTAIGETVIQNIVRIGGRTFNSISYSKYPDTFPAPTWRRACVQCEAKLYFGFSFENLRGPVRVLVPGTIFLPGRLRLQRQVWYV